MIGRSSWLPPSTACVNFTRTRGRERNDQARDLQRRRLRDRGDAARPRDPRRHRRDPRPRARRCSHLWPSYLAYVTSFLTIGIIWMNHHYCVETIARADRTLMFLNLLLLLTVGVPAVPDAARRRVPAAARRAGRRLRVRRDVRRDGDRSTTLWWRYASTNRRLIGETFPTRPSARSRARSTPACRSTPSRCSSPCSARSRASFLTFAIAAFYLPSAALFER